MNIGDLVKWKGSKERFGIITKKIQYEVRKESDTFARANWEIQTEVFIHWLNPQDNEETGIKGWKYAHSDYLEVVS